MLCSGKVFYDLLQRRTQEGVGDVALVRVEQLYPYPEARLAEVAARYASAREVVWAQEETQNRGAWSFMFPRLLELFPKERVRYAGPAAERQSRGRLPGGAQARAGSAGQGRARVDLGRHTARVGMG